MLVPSRFSYKRRFRRAVRSPRYETNRRRIEERLLDVVSLYQANTDSAVAFHDRGVRTRLHCWQENCRFLRLPRRKASRLNCILLRLLPVVVECDPLAIRVSEVQCRIAELIRNVERWPERPHHA